MGSILGLGRGKTNANLALTGFDFLKDNAVTNQAQQLGQGANAAIAGALGLPGGTDQSQSLNNFMNSLGFQNRLEQGGKAITSSAAARGQLNSGATLKALNRFGQQEAQKGFESFLGQLGGLAGQGQQAAIATGAAGTSGGSTAASTQPQNKGILGRFFGI